MSHFIDDDDQNECDDSEVSVRLYLRRIAQRRFSSGCQAALIRITDLTVPGIMEEAKRRGDPAEAYVLVREAIQIVDEMDSALHGRNQHASKHRSGIWWHIPDGGIVPAGSDQQDKHNIDRAAFEQTAGQYLARPWMQHDHLDWCVVDALVRWEWAACYYNITDPLSAKLSGEAEIKRFSRRVLAVFYTVYLSLIHI